MTIGFENFKSEFKSQVTGILSAYLRLALVGALFGLVVAIALAEFPNSSRAFIWIVFTAAVASAIYITVPDQISSVLNQFLKKEKLLAHPTAPQLSNITTPLWAKELQVSFAHLADSVDTRLNENQIRLFALIRDHRTYLDGLAENSAALNQRAADENKRIVAEALEQFKSEIRALVEEKSERAESQRKLWKPDFLKDDRNVAEQPQSIPLNWEQTIGIDPGISATSAFLLRDEAGLLRNQAASFQPFIGRFHISDSEQIANLLAFPFLANPRMELGSLLSGSSLSQPRYVCLCYISHKNDPFDMGSKYFKAQHEIGAMFTKMNIEPTIVQYCKDLAVTLEAHGYQKLWVILDETLRAFRKIP